MATEQQTNVFEFNPDELGQPIVEWDVDEYPQHIRSRLWYVLAGLVSVGLVIYSVATSNFLFAIIILMGSVLMLLSIFMKPARIPVVITSTGIIIGDLYYDYQAVKDFSIVYDPPEVKILYLDFYALTHPLIAVPLEDVDPNIIRENLLTFCQENLRRNEEGLTDLVRRVYKL